MAIKTDCAAWDKERKSCRALTELLCDKRPKCPFYKTKEQVDAENEKNADRREAVVTEKEREEHEKDASYARAWRAKRVKDGVCIRCGRPTDRPGLTLCSACAKIKKQKEREQAESEKMLNALLGSEH